MRCGMTLLVVTIMFALVACSESTRSSTASTSTPHTGRAAAADVGPRAPGRREQALRDPSSSDGRADGGGAPPASGLPRPRLASKWEMIARPRISPLVTYSHPPYPSDAATQGQPSYIL
jgi:hypothetical protein